ncbi:putative fatty acyl-CoA reductase CG5065 [Argiope bruennichi]|uniref:Fatty acyl-CoA reductase n=1 Tax=Argiope bruennichi TaxID=94029 RepID=A0A8T0FIG2_ARGBR|nr:putative fatty acyl-CoA reductase CG5065 [Argiope bruennichi]KAF8790736.1 putative fatty acyl-CoA reductase CG5065 like protein [Argiope bruennichi]
MAEEAEVKPSIPDIFKGKSVFITGGNGFLGKVLLEKLLRSCPGIFKIIVLLNNAYETEVFEKKRKRLLESNVFDRLKKESPTSFCKLHFVAGDVTVCNLGLKNQDLIRVTEDVSFVFHCAASVRFEDKPRTTMMINVVGVDRVAKLCLSIKNLEALVHVSTAYSFCHHAIISEDICLEKLPISVIRDFEHMDDDRIEWICNSYRKNRPSNYQYSKALAETLIVKEYFNQLPIIIVRPGIITAAVREPYPGWIDNYNGPSGFIAMSVKGVLKTLLVKEGVYADWVPVDIVANTLIVAAYSLLTQKESPSNIRIVNCVCPETKRINWYEVVRICLPILNKYPSNTPFLTPGGVVTSSETIHEICKYVLHLLPAAAYDVFTLLCKFKAIGMIGAYRRIHGAMSHLQLYTTRRFYFTSKNLDAMNENMLPADKEVFLIDQEKINWNQYLEDYVHGVRLFYLKESDESLDLARKKLARRQLIFFCLKIIPVGVLFSYILKKFCTPRFVIARLQFINLQFIRKFLKSILPVEHA